MSVFGRRENEGVERASVLLEGHRQGTGLTHVDRGPLYPATPSPPQASATWDGRWRELRGRQTPTMGLEVPPSQGEGGLVLLFCRSDVHGTGRLINCRGNSWSHTACPQCRQQLEKQAQFPPKSSDIFQ